MVVIVIVIILKNKQDTYTGLSQCVCVRACVCVCVCACACVHVCTVQQLDAIHAYTVTVSGGAANNDIPCQNNVVYGVCEMTQPNTLTTGPPPSSLQEYDYPLCDMSASLNDIPCQNNVVYGVCEMTQPNTLTTGPPPSTLQEYDYPLCDMSESLPPVYDKDEKLMINVNVSYAPSVRMTRINYS